MICPNCGKEITTKICYNCGYDTSGFVPNVGVQQNSVPTQTNVINSEDGFLTEGRLARKNGLAAKISAMDWFATFGIATLIALIPIVGSLGSLIYYIVLLCRKSTADSIRSYLKFNLIVSGVVLAITIVSLILFFVVFGASLGALSTEYTF